MAWHYDHPREPAPLASAEVQPTIAHTATSGSMRLGLSPGSSATAPIEFLRTQGVPAQRRQAAPLQAKRILREPFVSRLAQGAIVGQLALQPGRVIQMDTEIQHQTGTVTVGSNSYTVGLGMKAVLDPDDPVKGSATGPNWDWMKTLRLSYPSAGVVRGHLLNHDLGGYAVPENLYPISTKANADHSAKVEQNVKKALTDANAITTSPKPKITYQVLVKEGSNPPEKAQFLCAWNDETGKGYKDIITSDLGNDAGGFGGKGPNTSPVAWQHGKRRGAMDWTTMIGALNPKIKVGGTTGLVGKEDAFTQQIIDTVFSVFNIDGDAEDIAAQSAALSRLAPEKWMPYLKLQGFTVTLK